MRLGSGLATAAAARRLRVTLPEDATVEVLLRRLGELEPALAPHLDAAVPIVRGAHATPGQRVSGGDEIALLIPVAGG